MRAWSMFVGTILFFHGFSNVVSAAAGAPPSPQPELTFNAKVFQADSDKKKLLFTYEGYDSHEGGRHLRTSTYRDTDGHVAAIEETVVADGAPSELISYRMDQKQIGAVGVIEVKDGRAHFSYARDGKTKTGDEKVGNDFIVGSTITPFLHQHWAEIMKGDKVSARFAVLDRQESVGFDYFKDHEETIDGLKCVAIKMKGSSFMIAALVDPLYFIYSMDGERLIEVRGRTQLKQMINGKLRELDAVTTFDYPNR